jgi:hypothetical protein
MMQKRKLTISLLLASFLLVSGFSLATAQTVTFQSKSVARCVDAVLNVTIDSPTDLSAFELVFEVSGDYTAVSFEFDAGLTLSEQVLQQSGSPDLFRVAAMKIDASDACLTGFPVTVGQIHLTSADVCDGVIDIMPTTIQLTTPCGGMLDVATGLVGCDPIEALATTVTAGAVTIVNQAPEITCPNDTTVHWNDLVETDVEADDPDLPNLCETLDYTVIDGPGAIDGDGHYTWQTDGDDVCDHVVVIEVADKCGLADTCQFSICVQNTPPEITNPQADEDTIFAVWGITLAGDVNADDPDLGPSSLLFEKVSFDGPTFFLDGFEINGATGEWTWDIGNEPEYLGDFTLCVKVSDGANVCDPCSPENADTACYKIHVTGFAVSIEKVHGQFQGHVSNVSIFIDSTYTGPFITDMIGGFDFLITYDASILAFQSAMPGDLIDTEFEYFTYRFGPFGNCDGGCPSGMLRVVALRESNNGILNPNHVSGPGELVELYFMVSNDRTYECQFVPVQFYWYDCGDNTIASENGNWLYLGQDVYSFEGVLVTDPAGYGFSGPEATCFDTVFNSSEEVKNYPLGAIVFRNGGVDIICADDIDDRGDINLNGIPHEIADAVVFTNYFIQGMAAFTVNEEGQMAATDVNADGQILSVADLVYLIRVIVGDAQPYDKLVGQPIATFSNLGDKIALESNAHIGAAYLVFDGIVYPSLAAGTNHMELKVGHVDNTTRVLVYSTTAGQYLTSGDMLAIDGKGTLVSAEAADYDGLDAQTKLIELPTEFTLNQNYPNPFNPSTVIEFTLPQQSDYTLTIFNVSGQKVAAFNGNDVGRVVKTWDASGMASGMYFYRIDAGDFSATKKMMLLK